MPDPDDDLAGVPDAFGRLWTPHRLAYIKGENKPSGPEEGEGCPFDRAPQLTDEEGLIVARGELVYAVLNLYPYNAGHVLICPYRHVADYTDLTEPETAEFSGSPSTRSARCGRPPARTASTSASTWARWPARASPPTCTSTWCPGGAATPTSCPSPATPASCPSSWPTPVSC